jgi:hypothetical protein
MYTFEPNEYEQASLVWLAERDQVTEEEAFTAFVQSALVQVFEMRYALDEQDIITRSREYIAQGYAVTVAKDNSGKLQLTAEVRGK